MAEQQKRISENRKLAKAVAAVCVAFCLLVMSPVKLNALRDSALDVFYNGSEENIMVSVNADMREAALYAAQLASMAEQIVPEDADIAELKALSNKIQSASEPNEILTAYASLTQTASNVYGRMREANPDSSIVSDASGKMGAIENKRTVIEKDKYFALARDFNKARNCFPASIIAAIANIDELSEK